MNARIAMALCVAGLATAAVGCGDSGEDPGDSSAGAGGSAGSETSASGAGGSSGAGTMSAGSAGKSTGGSGETQGGSGGKAGGGGSDAGGASAGKGGNAGGGGSGGMEPMIDCSQLPTAPLKVEELDGPRAYHDIAFDSTGNLIGANNEDLLKTAQGGKPKVFVAGVGDVEGMDTLPNGDLVVIAVSNESFEASLLRITPEGGQAPIAALEFGGYGVRVGPDGFIYVTTADALLRVNAQTGAREPVPVDLESWAPRVMDYSPDKKKLYVGAQGSGPIFEEPVEPGAEEGDGGLIYVFDLDEQGSPKGFPKLFAKNVGDGWIDGLNVDACGNLFVAEYFSTALYRVTPDGKVALFQDWNDIEYGHGIEWGSGVGGYEKTSLYLPQPYDENTVVRVDVGVPQRPR